MKLLIFLSLLCTFGTVASATNVADDVQPTLYSENGKLEVTLTIGEALYSNPDTGLVQRVVGYNGVIGGPTLYAQPGENIVLTLMNDLPPEPCNTFVPELFNQYHAVDISNLHFHGLHIAESMNRNSLMIGPGQNYTYNIHIPEGHSGGTFWYHPHFPGSTTLQAGGGAIGMLIVKDLAGDLPDNIMNLPDLNLRVQFLNFTYLQQDYATGTTGSYVPLCQQFGLPVDNRANCSEYFFENGPLEGEYNTTISPDGYEYETTLVNGVEQPTMQIRQNQWYRVRILYVPTRFRTLEPAFPASCEVQLLAKDGLYMLETPRPVKSGFMTSGNRADFLIRCSDVGEGLEFRSLSEARNSSNWIASQKRNSLDRVLAHFDVVVSEESSLVGEFSNPDKIPVFRPARPCYAANMMDVVADDSTVLMLSGLLPDGPPLADTLPIERPPCCSNTSYYDVNGLGPFNPDHRGVNGVSDREFDFVWETGQIVDIDFYGAQIHPIHYHINKFQLVELPAMDSHTDYFQPGDFHDVLHITIADFYGKTKLRMGVGGPVGEMLGHCHFYRHSDRGMAYLGNITGIEGYYSPKLGTCYTGNEDRGSYELVTPPSASPSASPNLTPSTQSPVTSAPVDPPATSAPASGSSTISTVFSGILALFGFAMYG